MTAQEVKRELAAILSTDVERYSYSKAAKMRYEGERVLK